MTRKGGAFIVWRDELSVGDALLDSQHQKIFDTINRLYEQMQAGISTADVLARAAEAARYAEDHFRCEEEAMRAAGYPAFEEHLQLHTAYRQEVQSRLAGVHGARGESASELLGYLKDWWKRHVNAADQAYSPYLKEPAHAARTCD